MLQGKYEMGFLLFTDRISSLKLLPHVQTLQELVSHSPASGTALFSVIQYGATSHMWLFEFKCK